MRTPEETAHDFLNRLGVRFTRIEDHNTAYEQCVAAIREERQHQAKLEAELESANGFIEGQQVRIDVLMHDRKDLEQQLSQAEARVKEIEDGLKDPVKLHIHILRTLTSEQIHHLLGDKVQQQLAHLQEENAKLLADCKSLAKTEDKHESIIIELQEENASLCADHFADLAKIGKLQEENDRLTRQNEWLMNQPENAMKARCVGLEEEIAKLKRQIEVTIKAWAEEVFHGANVEVLKSEIAKLQEENVKLKRQLPAGMEHCTIRFIGCTVGHGRLTADSWTKLDCPYCEIAKLQLEVVRKDEVLRKIKSCELDGDEELRLCDQALSQQTPPLYSAVVALVEAANGCMRFAKIPRGLSANLDEIITKDELYNLWNVLSTLKKLIVRE